MFAEGDIVYMVGSPGRFIVENVAASSAGRRTIIKINAHDTAARRCARAMTLPKYLYPEKLRLAVVTDIARAVREGRARRKRNALNHDQRG